MASDRFVYWRDEVPTVAQLRSLLEDYFGDLIDELTFEGSRFFVQLKSNDSFALRRQDRVNSTVRNHGTYMTACSDQRALEVFVYEGDEDDRQPNIDIITRHADEFTNDLAHGLMRLCARLWNGRLDIDQTTWMREEARRCESDRREAEDEAAERLLRVLRDKRWDAKAIDTLTQLVKCRA